MCDVDRVCSGSRAAVASRSLGDQLPGCGRSNSCPTWATRRYLSSSAGNTAACTMESNVYYGHAQLPEAPVDEPGLRPLGTHVLV